jgi:phenylacetate-CoA ligase
MLATSDLLEEEVQPHRLAQTLPRCLQEVPLYQGRRLEAGTVPGDGSTLLETFRRFPFITKHDIRRDFPTNFLGADVDLDTLVEEAVVELEHTSGTSEERTPLLLPRGWWGEQERRALALNPLVDEVLREQGEARRVTISSPVCSGEICYTGVPSRHERIVGNALFLSLSRYPFLWSEAELARMADEAVAWDPTFLDVDPVYGVVFALYCERQRIRLPALRFILCSYEFVSAAHRRTLQRVFGVPVLNLYGSTETGHLLMEDGQGRMRPSLDTAFLEVVDQDEAGIGELIVTTLTNQFMPLIRYRIGDLVQPAGGSGGRRYRVHGRAADAFATPQGRRVTILELDERLADLPGIAHYQLAERSGGRWLLRFVPDNGSTTSVEESKLRSRVADLLQIEGELQVQQTDLLMPENSGKFRLGYPLRRRS